ncbi:transcription antitermination factor NusB [Candidatus Roizmanbacteria bacterium]|nr:transcription antitermination factor NusB [Candidatus Roizmanbacteria bacterium]
MDPRHELRLKIIQQLYALSFLNTKDQVIDSKTKQVIKNIAKINILIKKYAPKYPLDRIAKVDLAILQLAVFELMFEKKQPAKVVIDEAVELAKELGSDKAYAFVNAVLGKIYLDNSNPPRG